MVLLLGKTNMRFLLVLLLAATAHATCPRVLSPDPPLSLSVRQPIRATPRIVGGELVSSNLYPYVVAILNNRRQLCTGVLISPHWFLTAAHCYPTTKSKAILLSSQVGVDGEDVNITNVYIHPRYGPEPGKRRYDVAAVEIEENARTLGAKFMKLSFSSRSPLQGSFVRTVGFGKIRSGRGYDPYPWALRQVDLPVADHRICEKNYAELLEPTKVRKTYHFCAGYIIDGGCDACSGDSGGPVIQYAGKRPVLQGIVSTGAGCGYPGYPGLNIRISALKQWLASTPAVYTRHGGKTLQVRKDCPAGKHFASLDGNLARCHRCPEGTVSSGGLRLRCDPCPENMDRDPENPSVCSCRAVVGYGFVNGTCVPCEAGFYSGRREHRCRMCPKGSFSPDVGSKRCLKCKTAKRGATFCPGRENSDDDDDR